MSERVDASGHGIGEQPPAVNQAPPTGQAPAAGEAATIYTDPRQVVDDPLLTIPQKRELLASWAADSRALPASPASRMLDSGAVVHVREILEALKSLDESERPAETDEQHWRRPPYARRAQATLDARRHRRPRRGQRDDDYDPPPCPVRSRPPGPTLPPLTAAATAPKYERKPDDALGRPMSPDAEPWWQRNSVAAPG